MYRDNTLVPTEAVRLLALGLLATKARRYSELAGDVRHFTGRMVGPSLDLVGAPLEVLKVEGLIAPEREGHDSEEDAPLTVTQDGKTELHRLLASNLRAPINELNKLIIALKIRFLHFLPRADQQVQAEMLVEISERELARLSDLRGSYGCEDPHFCKWLDQEITQVRARLSWYENLRDGLTR